ncbi:uncharacterized protein V2V93DRAFT_374818 [Kockiozyma suomiensis]|uniref:uncharacterized protein n=1 Tax=Kockiozyma suomiensis TaxID=1337062 RepID=UPI003343188D
MGNSNSAESAASEPGQFTTPGSNINRPELPKPLPRPPKKGATPHEKLHQLLRANHATYSVLYHNRIYHNHMPHLLGSAYLLGAEVYQLIELYEHYSKELDGWKEDSPQEVTHFDWRDFYGKKEYQRGYRDFFDDLVVDASFEWKRVISKFLLDDDATLLLGLSGGLAHPLIHLAYAYELNSAEVATEALTLDTTCFRPSSSFVRDFVNIYENMSITDRAEKLEKDPLKVLQIIRESTDISNAPISSAGALGASDDVLEQSKDAILALAVRLDFSDFQKTAQRIFHSTSLLATASHKPEKYNVDFVLLHTLTAAHAVQVILPYLPKKHKTQLVIELWLFVVITYISGQRPVIDEERIWSYEVEKENKSWDFIIRHAFSSEMRFDAHYLKVIRALKTLYETSTIAHDPSLYMLQATQFALETHGWTFGPDDEHTE